MEDSTIFNRTISMETEAQEFIEQWLAKVPEGPPSQPNCEGLNITEFKRNGRSSTTLEPTDDGPLVRLPKINRQSQDESAEPGQRLLQQIAGNQYERKPRRKTRDDKYEYKRPSSLKNRQSRTHKDKGKRTRTSRKHTMNDLFHASNVARERLTLRKTMNMGIFRKGKASSPIKLRDDADVAFSETQFIAKKDAATLGTGMWTVMDLTFGKSPMNKEQRLRPQASQYVFREPTKLVVAQTPAVSYAGNQARPNQGDRRHSPNMKDAILSPQFAGSAAGGRSSKIRWKAQDIQSSLPVFVEGSSSATPHTWSISDRHRSQQSREVEDRLLKILHVGLPQKPDDHDDLIQSNTQYCNTDDLRNLLESRKLYWHPETRHDHGRLDEVAKRNQTHSSIAMAHRTAHRPARVARSQSDNSETFSTSRNRAGLKGTSPEQVFDCPQNHFHGQEGGFTEDVSPSLQRNYRACHESIFADLDIEEDDIFFKKLDKAFGAVFEPEVESSIPLPIRRNKSHWSILYKPIDGASVVSHILHNEYQPTADPVDALLCDQPGLETLRTTGINHYPDLDNELSVLTHGSFADSKHQSLPLTGDILQRGLELPKLQTSNPFSTTAYDPCNPSVPPGFWRQNRLY